MNDLELFRDKLKARRKELHLTQAQLGERCGVSAQEISHYEKGRRTPELEMFIKLCSALDTTPNVLLWEYFQSKETPSYDSLSTDEVKEHVRNALNELSRLDDYYNA